MTVGDAIVDLDEATIQYYASKFTKKNDEDIHSRTLKLRQRYDAIYSYYVAWQTHSRQNYMASAHDNEVMGSNQINKLRGWSHLLSNAARSMRLETFRFSSTGLPHPSWSGRGRWRRKWWLTTRGRRWQSCTVSTRTGSKRYSVCLSIFRNDTAA
jgi:hypothetical protein